MSEQNKNRYLELAGGAPYHDDFDPRDNFIRILFNPARAVQARELTQLQTILANQTRYNSDFLFKDNSLIDGARITIDRNRAGVRVKDEHPTTFESLDIDQTWVGRIFTDAENPNDATKQVTITKVDGSIGDDIILYYDYSGTKIADTDILYWEQDSSVAIQAVSTFNAMAATCESGIIYTKGHFIVIPEQEIIITNDNGFGLDSDHGKIQIGYRIIEDIVTEGNQEVIEELGEDDAVLLGDKLRDPASGSRNANAPGAHRYRITAKLDAFFELLDTDGTSIEHRLTLSPIDYTEDELAGAPELTDPVLTPQGFPVGRPINDQFKDEFEPFIVMERQRITRDQTEPEFGKILNLLARRTFDQSGNWTVDDFDISIDRAPSPSNDLEVTVGPGRAYVRGYEVIKRNSTSFTLPRARGDLHNFTNARRVFGLLPYMSVDIAEGASAKIFGTLTALQDTMKFNAGDTIEFMNRYNGQGDVIAEGRLYAIDRNGTNIRIYFSDVGILADNKRAFRSIRRKEDPTVSVNSAHRQLNTAGTGQNTEAIIGGNSLPLILKVNQVEVPRDFSNVHWTVSRRKLQEVEPGGVITLTIPTNANVADANPLTLIYNKTTGEYLDPIDDVVSISFTGQPTVTLNGDKVSVDDEIIFYYNIVRFSPSGDEFFRTKTLREKEEIITIPAGQNVVNHVSLDEEDCYDVLQIEQITNVDPAIADNQTGEGGPNFGIPDGQTPVKKLTQRDLLLLKFHDGQTDEYYDQGALSGWKKLWSKYKNNETDAQNHFGDAGVGGETQYRVTYRYFEHNNNDRPAFGVTSYLDVNDSNLEFQGNLNRIPSYNSDKFGRVDLVACLDFRRKKSSLVSDAFAGTPRDRILPGSIIQYDVSHHYGRIDSISVHKNGDFIYKQGIPSENPSVPPVPDNSMLMFNMYIPPYTFTSKDIQVEAFKNTRYTMRDIGRLESRIERLEDSVSLSLLEQAAFDSRIIDGQTGLDRFKSGIFVDSFEGLGQTNTLDDEFYIAVDRIERTIHCPVQKRNIPMTVADNAQANIEGMTDFEPADVSNDNYKIKKYKNLITLAPVGERIEAENQTATGYVNLNPYLFYTWIGQVELDPAVDTWHEENYLPQQTITVGSWDPPPGFNPDWAVDDVEITWVGVKPDPPPPPPPAQPPAPTPAPPSAPPSGGGSSGPGWGLHDITIGIPLIFSNAAQAISNPDYPPGMVQTAINNLINLVEQANLIAGDGIGWFAENFLSWNSQHLNPDLQTQEILDELLGILNFEGTINTGTNFGSGNILSTSEAGRIAQGIGEEEFNSLQGDISEQSASRPVEINKSSSSSVFDVTGSVGFNSKELNKNLVGAQQHITITEVKDVLKKHTKSISEDRVIDKSTLHWMRERLVAFDGAGFRPGMRVLATLDNRQVQIVPDEDYLDNDGNYRVDGDGNIKGWFRIPPRTFTTGTKTFMLMDVDGTSQGSADFTSKGILTTRQETITTIRSVSVRQIRRTLKDIKPLDPGDEDDTITPIGAVGGLQQNPDGTFGRVRIIQTEPGGNTAEYSDPVAQSFLINSEGGCFLKSIEVYFATKAGDFTSDDVELQALLEELFPGHPSDAPQLAKPFFSPRPGSTFLPPVTMYLVEVLDGNPTRNVVPLSEVTMTADQINADPENPQEGRTEFVFNDPVYLEEGAEYAFVLATPSKEYNIWVTELGEQDVFAEGLANPGTGVAEQPYLGSMFKSQNSFTWTAVQDKTVSFRIRKHVYSVDPSQPQRIFLMDSKKLDISKQVSANTLVDGKPLYFDITTQEGQDAMNGDPRTLRTWVGATFPIIGELEVPGTDILWEQGFKQFEGGNITGNVPWLPMQNMKRNLHRNSASGASSHEYLLDKDNFYFVRGTMSTENPNLTPVIDKDQMRMIAMRNLVKGIEPLYNNNPNEGFFYQTGTAYDRFDILFDPSDEDPENAGRPLPGAPRYFVVPSTLDASSLTFNEQLAAGGLRLLEDVEVNIPEDDGTTRGNAGIYVSKTINLKDPADDLRLIIDSSEPGNSFVKPYFKILDQESRYVNTRVGSVPADSETGKEARIYYAYEDVQGHKVVKARDHDNNINHVTINGIDNVEHRAYISGVSRQGAFTVDPNNYIEAETPSLVIASSSKLFEDRVVENPNEPIQLWQAGNEYDYNEIVWHENAFWKANGYMVSLWEPGTYEIDDRVRTTDNRNWLALVQTTEEPGTGDDWREVENALYFPRNTKPTDGGQGWTRVPTILVDGVDKDPDPSEWEVSTGIVADTDQAQWRPMVIRGTRFENNKYRDKKFYESTWVPRTNPGIEFTSFAIKLEMVAVDSRVDIPRCRNLRVIATL